MNRDDSIARIALGENGKFLNPEQIGQLARMNETCDELESHMQHLAWLKKRGIVDAAEAETLTKRAAEARARKRASGSPGRPRVGSGKPKSSMSRDRALGRERCI